VAEVMGPTRYSDSPTEATRNRLFGGTGSARDFVRAIDSPRQDLFGRARMPPHHHARVTFTQPETTVDRDDGFVYDTRTFDSISDVSAAQSSPLHQRLAGPNGVAGGSGEESTFFTLQRRRQIRHQQAR